jgi:poly(3-hydroxyalkanoate) synthetase
VASHSCLVDLTDRTSQVRLAADAGLGPVFALEWTPTPAAADARVEEYVAAIHDAIEVAGGRVRLVGNSMGGWLSVIYSALRPERVASLTVIGSPVDFHAGAFPPAPLEGVAAFATARAHEAMVALHRGAVPGNYLLAGLVAAQPEDAARHSTQLLLGLRDPQTLEDHRRFMAWYHSVRPFPGVLYRWIVRNLYERNALIDGTLRVDGRAVDLSRISCPVTLLAGDRDRVAPAAGLRPLIGAVSTAAAQIDFTTARGGHLDLFISPEMAQGPIRRMFEQLAQAG